jgi:aminoglycoside/choline kinase family phosphotransferase
MSHTPFQISPVHWADPSRASRFQLWLGEQAACHHLNVGSLVLASADASFRRYLRIQTQDGGSRIIMDAPPDKENCQPFVHVARLMADAGLNAPEVLAWDEAHGFMLLTDLGGQTLLQHMATQGVGVGELYPQEAGERFLPLMKPVITELVKWQQASRPGLLPAYDDALLSRELALFPEWYLAQHKGIDLNAPEHAAKKQVLDDAFTRIKQQVLKAPSVFVHRDFMLRNLMLNAGGAPGVLDFQDAVYGPITYDIASLMRDAFVSWEEEFVMDVTIRYWSAAKKVGLIENGPWGDWADDFGAFYANVEWMGLQRHLKVAGIFARLTLRDGKPQYLADAPRFINYIRHTCNRYGVLKPLMRLIDEIEDIQVESGYQFGR